MGYAIFDLILARYEQQIYGRGGDSQLPGGFTDCNSKRRSCACSVRRLLGAIAWVVLVVYLYTPSQVDAQGTLVLGGSERSWDASDAVPSTSTRPRIALVLTGGGARGLSQIGALRILDSAGIHPSGVVGTSIGAIVGGLYCAGYTADELDSIFSAVEWSSLLGYGDETDRSSLPIERKAERDRSLLTLRFDGVTPQLPEAVSIGGRISRLLDRLVWQSEFGINRDFGQLKYRFRAVTTDLVGGSTVVLDTGNLAIAIRASATVPLRFSPVRIDSMLLVDGGLLENIPVDIARSMGCDLVVVINTTAPLLSASKLDEPLNVADQIITLMMRSPAGDELSRADVVITPAIGDHSSWDFGQIRDLVHQGEQAARASIPQLQRLIDSLSSMQRSVPPVAPASASASTVHVRRSSSLNGVVLDGLGALDTSRFSSEIEQIRGKPVGPQEMSAFARAIERKGRRLGYAYLSVRDASISADTLYVDIDEGVIHNITVVGIQRTDTVVVTREIGFEIGDPFKVDEADAALTRLLATGLYQQARFDLDTILGGGVSLCVEVSERATALMRLQASVDNERYTQLGVEITEESLFGRGIRASLRLGGGLRDRIIEASLGSDRLNATYWTLGLLGYGSIQNVNRFERTLNQVEGVIERTIIGEFKRYRSGIRARAGRLVGSVALLSVTGRFERQGASGITVDPDDPVWRGVSSISVAATVDTRDQIPFPMQGTLLGLSYETSPLLLGGDEPFVKAELGWDYYIRVGEQVFCPRLKLGFADQTLPPNEFFSLGGEGSIYGLREDELRGRQMFLASLEYRRRLPFKVFFDTYLAVRYDIGSTWLSPTQIRLADLDHGLGVTIGLDTPVGPASFSLGESFTFNRADRPANYAVANVGPVVAYFTIGHRLR